jgi:CRISPR/Cas system-associated exonuclease Cas4 (RecB family)
VGFLYYLLLERQGAVRVGFLYYLLLERQGAVRVGFLYYLLLERRGAVIVWELERDYSMHRSHSYFITVVKLG